MIIGLHGKMGSGKSTVANELVGVLKDHNIKAEIKSFAKPIYELVSTIFQVNVEEIKRNKNDVVRPRSFSGLRSYRQLLQNIGMDLRELVDIDIWIDALFGKGNSKIVSEWTGEVKWWIIDDLRFLNELNRIKQMNGQIIKISRDIQKHRALPQDIYENQSELDLDEVEIDDWDLIIDNNATLDSLTDILNNYITTLINSRQ